MPRPIVVIAPEAEREALRNAGVLPPGFFRGFGEDGTAGPETDEDPSILLWPHSIDYSAGARLAERMDERPPDIPSFFGIPPGEDDAARMANERLAARLLDGTVVHVVFLERESSRPGYARIGSFAQLTSWSRAFRKALRARFTNEAEFQRMENVLVVVSRGEQAKTTKEELEDFQTCFGEGQAFRSCYFLDYTLQAADTRQLFHSALVWDVAVARLLLAFLLSREASDADGGHNDPCWSRTGIRLWRALECRAVLSAAVRERASDSLGAACEHLQGQLGGTGFPEVPVPPMPTVDLGSVPPLEPSDTLDPEWRRLPEGGWSDFDASGSLVARTQDESRWTDAFQTVSDQFADWSRQNRPDSGRRGIRDRFQGVHLDPRRLFAERRALFEALKNDKAESERAAGGEDPLAKTWDRVAELTKAREDVLLRLGQESRDFALARKHYAGWGMGLLAAASVSCLCGWVLFRIVAAIGASPLYAVLFGGATACGAVLACCGVLWLHARSGRLGALAYAATSRKSDEVAVERDGVVRELVRQALAVGRRARLRGQFFRAWALLNRTEQILLTELQPAAAAVALENDAAPVEAENDAMADPRETFVRLTCRGFGEGDENTPFEPDLAATEEAPGIEDVVRAWWEGPPDAIQSPDLRPRESFRDLWIRLCKLDVESAGYFPAKTFSREIGAFVADFAEAVRRLASRRARDGNVESFHGKIKDWLSDDVCAANVNQFASAAFTAMQTNDDQRRTGHVWFVDDERIADPAVLEDEARLRGNSFQALVHPSPILSRLPQMGFFFQEFDVGFGLDETEGTGRLIITEASHE